MWSSWSIDFLAILLCYAIGNFLYRMYMSIVRGTAKTKAV